MNQLGLIDYKPNQALSDGQKSWVVRQFNENKQLLKNPDNFVVRKVSKETAKELKSSGFQVTKNGKAIISKKGFDKVTIQKGKVVFQGVNKRSGALIKETVTPAAASNFHDKLKKLLKTKLKKNQYITVKIGDNASFNTRFDNYAALYNYVVNVFTPKDRGVTKESLMRYMSVVEVNYEKKKRKN